MIRKVDSDTQIFFAIKPKHPTRKAADRVLGIQGVDGYSEPCSIVRGDDSLEMEEEAVVSADDYTIDVVEMNSPRQALAVMDTSYVAIMHEDKFYPVDETNVYDQFDLVAADEAPTVEEDAKFGVYKLEHFVKDPIAGGEAEDADVLGKTLNVLQKDVKIENKIITGSVLKVTDYTGFNGSDVNEQNGYYLTFWIDKTAAETAGYSDIKFFVVGGKNLDGVTPDQGMNIIFFGNSIEDVSKKTLGLRATLTIPAAEDAEDDAEDIVIPVEIAFENKLIAVDMEAELTTSAYSGSPSLSPVVDEANKKVYLNGIEGTVRANSNGKGAEIVANGKVLASGYMTGWALYGGGPAGTHVAKSRINVDSVQVGGLNVFGGGEGSYDQSEDTSLVADVDNAVVVINGDSRLKNVFGGGTGRGTVKKATVVINGGTFSSIEGGGMAYVDKEHNIEASAAVNPENSANRVENAVVIINNASMDVNGLVYGGCQGYGCVENTDVTINNIDGTKAWTIGGGSNGYVGNAKITINNAKAINSVCNINRGWAKSAEMIINGGTITNVYAGADEEDTKTSQMEHHGCQEKLTVIINGGTITSLLPGYNYSAIQADDPKVSVFVSKDAVVKNIDDAKTAFGTSITVEGEEVPPEVVGPEKPGTDDTEESGKVETDTSKEGSDEMEPVD